jgi:hypothetical protein
MRPVPEDKAFDQATVAKPDALDWYLEFAAR